MATYSELKQKILQGLTALGKVIDGKYAFNSSQERDEFLAVAEQSLPSTNVLWPRAVFNDENISPSQQYVDIVFCERNAKDGAKYQIGIIDLDGVEHIFIDLRKGWYNLIRHIINPEEEDDD